MTRKKWAIALLLLAAIAIGAWLIQERPPQATSVPADVAAPPQIARGASDFPPSSTRATPLPPMPLTGVPLRDALPSLRERADAGDGKAACRLALELLRCRESAKPDPEEEQRIEELLNSRPEGRSDPMADLMSRQLALRRGVRAACAGLPAGLEDEAGSYLRAAALAGEPEALFRYAAGEGFDKRDGYGFILTPQFDQWRLEAPALMDRAMAGGDPRAVLALYEAQQNDFSLFAGLIAGEAAGTHAYAILAQKLYGESLMHLYGPMAFFPPMELPALSAEESQHAEARAEAWHQDNFNGQQLNLIDMALDYMLLPEDATAAEVLGRDACASGEAPDHG